MRVLRVPPDCDPQVPHHGPRLAPPIRIELAAVRVEEDHPAHVWSVHRVVGRGGVDVTGEQQVAQLVPGQHVRTPAEDQDRDAIECPHQVERLRTHLLRARPADLRCPPSGDRQSLKVVPLVAVELEGTGDRLEHLR